MRYLQAVLILCIISCIPAEQKINSDSKLQEENWETIFNGVDLTGWTVKINGYEMGNNYAGTFSVVDSAITVSYDNYEDFGVKYGHLFYKDTLSHYKLNLDYRFLEDQAPGGEGWAYKNSGIMYHGQPAHTMLLDQGFPVSLEAQFLGGNGKDKRPTANLCTPGMHVNILDSMVTDHCIMADAPTFHGSEWVNFELVVYGDSVAYHLVNGDTVFTLSKPVIGGDFLPAEFYLEEGSRVKEGSISLQSESHPIQFRNIKLLRLD